jgi:translation initiation factor 2-alpha kinase 3
MTSNAKWVKLIPSLAGGLYKFDGASVEAVPLDAETLLRSSFKFADNTVITGGKESRQEGMRKRECEKRECDEKKECEKFNLS